MGSFSQKCVVFLLTAVIVGQSDAVMDHRCLALQICASLGAIQSLDCNESNKYKLHPVWLHTHTHTHAYPYPNRPNLFGTSHVRFIRIINSLQSLNIPQNAS